MSIKKILLVALAFQLAILVLIGLEALGLPIFPLKLVIGFVYLTFIPGILIMLALKLYEPDRLEIFLYSIGLSIGFVTLFGLLMNFLYPVIGFNTPFSFLSTVLSMSVAVVILLAIAYWRNRRELNLESPVNFRLDIPKDSVKFLLVFPFLFPVLGVLGVLYENPTDNNQFLMAMLFLIPLYVFLVVWFHRQIPKATYPVALLLISLSLLLMTGLRSSHILSEDMLHEFYVFNQVRANSAWLPVQYTHGGYASCASISILPTIYSHLTGLSGENIFKIMYQLIFSVTPLGVYVIARRYLNDLQAFLAAFFFMAQSVFIRSLANTPRVEISMLLFVMAMMVLFGAKGNKIKTTLILFVFMVTSILSYYTTAIILPTLLVMAALAGLIWKKPNAVILSIAAISVFIFFLWWGVISARSFATLMVYLRGMSQNIGGLFSITLRDETIQQAVGIGVTTSSQVVIAAFYYITAILVVIGVLSLIWQYRKGKSPFPFDFVAISTASLIMMVSFFILPVISQGFGTVRLYQILLMVLAPALVVGGEFVFKHFKPMLRLSVITLILAFQFLCAGGVFHQVLESPYDRRPAMLDSNNLCYDVQWLYDQDIAAGKWLFDSMAPDRYFVGDRNTAWIPFYFYPFKGGKEPAYKVWNFDQMEASLSKWPGSAEAKAVSEEVLIKTGIRSIKIISNGRFARAEQDMPDCARFANKQITLGAWCYARSTNDKTSQLVIFDRTKTSEKTIASSIPNDDTWHWVTVTANISANPMVIMMRLFVNITGDMDYDDTLYVDGAVLVEGDAALATAAATKANLLENGDFEVEEPASQGYFLLRVINTTRGRVADYYGDVIEVEARVSDMGKFSRWLERFHIIYSANGAQIMNDPRAFER